MSPSDAERVEAIWQSLAEDDAAEPLTARDLNLASLAALGESVTSQSAAAWSTLVASEGATRAKVRLYGPAVEANSAPVRLATKALSSFQDLVSAVAMSARGKKSNFGSVPGDIKQETELLMFPRPGLGSVVFELAGPEAPDTTEELPGVSDGLNVADRAAAVLGRVLQGSAGDVDRSALAEDLTDLGPRVATHLRKLAMLPIADSMYLELEWLQGNGQRVRGTLGPDEAIVLRDVITESRASVEVQTLEGVLVTLSSEEPLSLRLHGGGRVPMRLSDDLSADDLTAFFNSSVVATAEVEVTTHPTTGKDSRRYTLIGIDGALEVDVE